MSSSIRTRVTSTRVVERQRQATQVLYHRLRPHGDGQLDILIQYSTQTSSSRRRAVTTPSSAFLGGIASALVKLWPNRDESDIPHFPARIVQVKTRGPSSRDPAIAVVAWVGWLESAHIEEPLHQIAEDAPELLDDYYRRYGTTTLTPSPNESHPHQLVARFQSVRNVVVVSGAGISVSAVPTFGDLRSRFGPNAFHTTALATEPSTFPFHDLIRHLHHKASSAQSSASHRDRKYQ
ncbi:hypothetical protein F5Y16DRAFT_396553 [Xylariaceae sp. FL0255]|nr:hypothetical protein F5Y16DRAFT_396553 [Xylariaceae sp. FL0255]